MKKIQSKTKALELPHDNMLFFGAQGQITPKSVVGSGRNSNSFKPLCMSFGCEGGVLVLIASVPGHCLSFVLMESKLIGHCFNWPLRFLI